MREVFEALKKAIEALPHRVKPISKTSHSVQGSDGLKASCKTHEYDEKVTELNIKIWNSGLPLKDKMKLNELLFHKLSI